MSKKYKGLLSVIVLLIILVTIVIVLPEKELIGIDNEDIIRTIDVTEYVNKIKEDNAEYNLVSEKEFDSFVNIVFNKDNDYKSYFVSRIDGNTIDFVDVLSKDSIDKFNDKVNELLNLKYPKFIVDGINGSDGKKSYLLKNDEMIIYYNDYIIEPAINEVISLKVNYNEVKDYLNFNYDLDSEYKNESAYDYDPTKKTVAITFDDGPSSSTTPLLMNYLKDNKVHATFFMVGNNIKNNPTVVKQVYDEGHEIASHSLKHANLKKLSIDAILEDLNTTNEYYKNITGEDLKILRPPYGSMNNEMLEQLEMPIIIWSVDTLDWKYRDVDTVVNNIMSTVKDGDIILLHDIHPTSVEAANKVLPLLYAQGYQVVNVSKLAELKGQPLEAHKKYFSIANS